MVIQQLPRLDPDWCPTCGLTIEESYMVAVNPGEIYTLSIFSDAFDADWESFLRADLTSAPIPEPITILLFGTGVVGLVGSRLRRKKKM